jgi:predicted metal-binding protein
MDELVAGMLKSARELGIETCVEFEAALLVPEERIREYCYENKCGNYRNNYMCPPHVGSIEEIRARLSTFRRGVLLQYSKPVDVRNDIVGVRQTRVDFHRKILRLEAFLKEEGVDGVWGMIGGSCALCEVCKAKLDEPCPFPDEARASLESIGIDVLALLERFGLDNKFRPDRITWTGCILF